MHRQGFKQGNTEGTGKPWQRALGAALLFCIATAGFAGVYTTEFVRIGTGGVYAGTGRIAQADAGDRFFIANVRQESASYRLDPVLYFVSAPTAAGHWRLYANDVFAR